MKTEAQFNLLAQAYRSEVRWRAMLFSPIIVIAVVFCYEVGSLMERIFGDHYLYSIFGQVVTYAAVWGLMSYYSKSKESLARKLDLVCSSCSHPLRPDDFKRLTAPEN